MSTLCTCIISVLLVLSSCGTGLAQTIENDSFDPRPVEIPDVQKSAVRSVASRDLLNLRDLHGIQISPNGRYVAFVVGQAVYETNSYRSGLFVVDTESGRRPTSLGTAGPPHWDAINLWRPDPPQWSADSRYIFYRMKIGGAWQVWMWNREGGTPIQVTHVDHDVKKFQVDGTKLVLVVDRPFTAEQLNRLAEHGVLYDGSIYAWEGKPFLNELAEATRGDTETWIHDLRDGEEHKAAEQELKRYGPWESDLGEQVRGRRANEDSHILSAKISPDGRFVVYQRYTDDSSESARASMSLYLKPVRGGSPVALTASAYYIDQYWWSQDGREIYYTEYGDDGHPGKLLVIAATGGTPRHVLSTTDYLDEYSADSAGRLLACARQNNTTPPQVAFANTSTGEVRILADVNPEVQYLQLSPAKRVDVSNKYGDKFFGHLVLPHNYEPGKRYPLIVTTYTSGDTFLRGGTGDEYPIQVFAANGFAVLDFDVGRDRNYRSGDFDTAVLRDQSPVEGMQAAVAKLTNMGIIDPSKVGITGLSRGAEIVSYAISHKDLFQAAIASSPGGNDPYFFYMAGKAWHKIFANMGLGGWPEGKSSANWHKFSPALGADHIKAPLLLNAADSEYLAGLQLVTSLKQLGKPVELFIYPNERHIKIQPKHRYEIYERNVDWFKFWLKGEEDPDSAKADQYKRWRELRRLQQKNEARRTSSKQ